MRMIDRTRKEGIKNGFQVTLSLLAARTKRAAGCDKFSASLRKDSPHHPTPKAAVCFWK